MIHFHGISLGLFFSLAFVQGGEPHFSLIYKVSDSALFISTALSIVAPSEGGCRLGWVFWYLTKITTRVDEKEKDDFGCETERRRSEREQGPSQTGHHQQHHSTSGA